MFKGKWTVTDGSFNSTVLVLVDSKESVLVKKGEFWYETQTERQQVDASVETVPKREQRSKQEPGKKGGKRREKRRL